MDTQRVRLLQQSIDAERGKLEEAIQGVVAQPCADDNEMASHYESTHAGIMFMRRARERLLYLTRQMEVIENRPYAVCVECGETIAPQRLAAVPDAVRCAECQMEWEEEERLRHLPFCGDVYDAVLHHI